MLQAANLFLDLTAGKWKESSRVLELLGGKGQLVVLHRSSSAPSDDSDVVSFADDTLHVDNLLLSRRLKETNARLLRIGHLGSISSTQVRECKDLERTSAMVVPRVLEYMRENHLYQFGAAIAETHEDEME